MNPLFAKLNYKEGQTIFVLNHPLDFKSQLDTIEPEIIVRKKLQSTDLIEFVLVFAITKKELEDLVQQIFQNLHGDAVVWAAYPKGTSKKYKCDFNRDTSWELFAPYKMLAVRQISIDDDWSALRFRKAEFIKSVTRKNSLE